MGHIVKEITSVSGDDWQMSHRERMFAVGLVAALRPARTLEVGVWHGGYTKWLKKYSDSLVCVDMLKMIFFHDIFIQDFSDNAFKKLIDEKAFFDLIVIDACHETENAYRDLKNAMQIGKTILLHDTYNEECRAGYCLALTEMAEKIEYLDLDAVIGNYLSNGKWGGLGLVITK
jgi:hypothetical protein